MSENATEVAEKRRELFAYTLPFAAFLLLTAIEGKFGDQKGLYATLYVGKIAVLSTILILTRRAWPAFRWNGVLLGTGAGIVGVAAWILLAKIDLLGLFPESIRGWLGGQRVGLEPTGLKEPFRSDFIALRLFGLAIVVPLMEELFWRGFLMRYLISEDFNRVPIGTYTRNSFVIVTLLFTAVHPEILAALVWGAAINLLLYRTKNLWACVAMHATTNALLGVYILATDSWQLW